MRVCFVVLCATEASVCGEAQRLWCSCVELVPIARVVCSMLCRYESPMVLYERARLEQHRLVSLPCCCLVTSLRGRGKPCLLFGVVPLL